MKPHPSCYNDAILKKLVVFWKSVQLIRLQLAHSKEEERLRGVGSFTKFGWKLWCSGNVLWGSGNSPWLANCSPPHKGHCRLPQDVLQAYWRKTVWNAKCNKTTTNSEIRVCRINNWVHYIANRLCRIYYINTVQPRLSELVGIAKKR